MLWRLPWVAALVVLASACDDTGTVSRLEAAKRRLGNRIEERRAQLDKGEFARRELEVLREKLQEVRHVSTREELQAKVAALPEAVRVEVLEELEEQDVVLRVRFSGKTERTVPRGAEQVLRFDFLTLEAFQSDENGWTAEGRLHLTHPCEHPSWDEEPMRLPAPGFLEGLRTRRLRDEIAEGSRELATLDAQLSARGVAEMPRQRRCAEHMLSHLDMLRWDSVKSAWSSLWETFPMPRGRLRGEGDVVIFEGRFPGDTRGLPWVRVQGPGEWKWEESSLRWDHELVEFRPEGLLKLRRRRGGGQ